MLTEKDIELITTWANKEKVDVQKRIAKWLFYNINVSDEFILKFLKTHKDYINRINDLISRLKENSNGST